MMSQSQRYCPSDSFVPVLQKVLHNFRNTSQQNAEQEFQLLELESEAGEKPSRKTAVCGNNFRKNRYKDILPYDYNLVKIDPNDPDNNDYINASYITDYTGGKLLIASQAPLPNTVHDFWHMCWGNNVKTIVMLCDFTENGRKKCEMYFPTIINEPFETDELLIELETCTPLFGDLTVRKLIVTSLVPTCNGTTQKREIKHVQYTGWPDFGVSGHLNKIEAILDNLSDSLEESGTTESAGQNTSIPIVHCSAGCGRTGTIACLLYIAKLIHNKKLGPDFSLVDLVLQLRRERQNMVQSKVQYAFIVEFVAKSMLQKELNKYLSATADKSEGEHSRADSVSQSRRPEEHSLLYEATTPTLQVSVADSGDRPLIDLHTQVGPSPRSGVSTTNTTNPFLNPRLAPPTAALPKTDNTTKEPKTSNVSPVASPLHKRKVSQEAKLVRRSPVSREQRPLSPADYPQSSSASQNPPQSAVHNKPNSREKDNSSENVYELLSQCASGVSRKPTDTASNQDSSKNTRSFAGLIRQRSLRAMKPKKKLLAETANSGVIKQSVSSENLSSNS